MGSIDKSKLFKEMTNTVNLIRGFIKKMGSNYTFKCENDKEKLFNFFRDNQDVGLISTYENLKYSHHFYFFELSSYYLEISLVFDNSFCSYNELKEKSTVYINLRDKYGRPVKHIYSNMSFNTFKKKSSDLSYLVNFFESHDLYNQPNQSIKEFMVTQFKDAYFSKDDSFECFIKYIKSRKERIDDVINAKNKFISLRKKINKTQKDNKNKYKGQVNTKVQSNNQKIKELERQIQALKRENHSLKNKVYSPESDYQEKNEFEYNYNLTLKYFINDYKNELRKIPFTDSIDMMLKI